MPSAAGPAAALGLKTQSALMSGDMDLATTTAAGAAQNAAAQAQSLAAAAAATAAPAGALPAAARSGAYRWGAMDIASHSLPAVPARSSSAGRPARPVAAIFQPGHRPAAGRSASAPRPKKRGRPPKAGGEMRRDAVSVTDLAQLVCTVIKAQPQAAATAATGATATARKHTRNLRCL
jgi:hypothetical protein